GRVIRRQLDAGAGKQLQVLGVRARPAGFDEVDAELVEPPDEDELVLDCERDALTLCPVAERGVVDGHAHRSKSSICGRKQRRYPSSSSPARRSRRANGSSSNDWTTPTDSTVIRSRSTVTTPPATRSSATGRSPFLSALPRKMSAKEGAMTARMPKSRSA